MNRQTILSAAVITTLGLLGASARAGTFKTIAIDGDFTDWAGVPVLASDPTGDGAPIDYGDVQIANDANNLYLRVTYRTAVNPNVSPSSFLSFDTDNNVATGFNIYGDNIVGAEASFQNDFGFEQRTGFNSGGLTAAASISPVDFANPADTFTSQEYSIPRSIAYSKDNVPVFGNSFTAMLWTDSSVAIDVTSGIPYTFASLVTGWAVGGSGDYNIASNWSSGAVPNAVGATAEFRGAITSAQTVYSNSAVTVGSIVFDNPNTYVLAGAGSMTLSTLSGNASVSVLQGTQKINLPLTIASNTTLTVAAGATLKISDPVIINAGKSLTASGTGTVTYESTINALAGASIVFGNSTHAAGLTLGSSATAKISGATAVLNVDALSLAAGSSVDVGTGELDATMTLAQTLANIQAGKIKTSLASSTRNVGYADLGGGKTKVVFALLGDANLDRTVNFDDLLALAKNYGVTSGKFFSQGDFTYDGGVDFNDLLALAKNYNQSFAAADLASATSADFTTDFLLAKSLVPEPTSIALLGLPIAAFARRRRV